MKRRRLAFCRSCGEPTWKYDDERISVECLACAALTQEAADERDAEEAFWFDADGCVGPDAIEPEQEFVIEVPR